MHLALTPVPVVPDQDEFVRVDGSEDQEDMHEQTSGKPSPQPSPGVPGEGESEEGQPALPCTPEQFATLRDLIGQDVAAEQCVARIIERLQAEDEAESPDLRTELAAAREEVLQLSSRIPPVMPGEVEAAMTETATAKFDAAVRIAFAGRRGTGWWRRWSAGETGKRMRSPCHVRQIPAAIGAWRWRSRRFFSTTSRFCLAKPPAYRRCRGRFRGRSPLQSSSSGST